MTDGELLEFAAKAAGYQLEGPANRHVSQGVTPDNQLLINDKGGHSVWNPLTDDGDALRLAVCLGMHLTLPQYAGQPTEVYTNRSAPILIVCLDTFEQTRRAIVMTAAEIGKAM